MFLHRHFDDGHVKEEMPEDLEPIVHVPTRNGERIAVYVATRNMYGDMVTAMKSLLCHSNVDKIVCLVEDDVFPLEIPKDIVTINVSGQQYFPANGPNARNHWTYMCLLRAVFDKIFPDFGVILSIDNDTAVVDDISDLWDIDMTDYYYAGVPDTGIYRPNGQPKYINGGVMLCNLDLLRANGIGDKMQAALNSRYYQFAIQDTIDYFCAKRIKIIPLRYNESCVTGRTNNPAIAHFVGIDKFSRGINAERKYMYDAYRSMTWQEVKACREERYGKKLHL